MSAADLSSIITSQTGVAANSEYGALPVPDASTFPFARVLPDQCRSCRLKDTHKVFSDIGIDSAPTRAQQDALIALTNNAITWVSSIQSLLQQMDRGADGMTNYTALTIGGQNMVTEVTYDLSSVSSSSVTLSWGEGDTHPGAIPYAYPNPNYVDATTTPDEPVTLTKYHPIHAPGIVRFNAPSSLRCWDGWAFKKVTVTASTITLYFLDDDLDMGLADAPLPNTDTSTITCTITQYPPPTNGEPWLYQRPIDPLYTIEQNKTLASPTQSLTTIATGRILHGSFTATDQSGNALSLASLVKIDQTSGGSFTSKLDLTSFDLTGITSIICHYRIESAATTGVIASGQKRCKHCIEDPTQSWGMSGDYFCAKRAELKADGATGEAILADFNSECYQYGVCQYFEADAPTNPWAAIEQICTSHPYMARTPYGGTLSLSRIGVPSLMSLTESLMEPQNGKHETREYGYGVGGWITAIREMVDGSYSRLWGLQSLRYGPSGEVPYFLDTATWPDYGPGGGANLSSRKNEYNETVAPSTITAKNFLEAAQVTTRDVDVHCYDFGVTGASGLVGKRQRFRGNEQVWIPQIGLDATATRNGHTIERGYWDDHFETCSEGSETYRIKVTLGSPYWQKYAEEITTVTVRACNFYGTPYGSIVELYLEHKTVSVSIDIEDPADPPSRMEVSKSWKQGGTNVALPEYFRPWNYDCDLSFHGPGQAFVRTGHVIVIGGHKLWITDAVPCASASYLGSWDVSRTTQDTDANERAYYAGNVDVDTMSGLLLPLAHGPNTSGSGGSEMTFWANSLDKIMVYDPNLITLNAGTIAGNTYSIRNDGWMLEGATLKSVTRGSSASLSTISGAAVLGADGIGFIQADITNANACLVFDGADVADRIMMPTARETSAIETTIGRMMRE